MLDFRDAKTMAHNLRAALAARDLRITIGQSLELIAEAFGVADWNTLSAAILAATSAPRDDTSPPLPAVVGLEIILHLALSLANQRKHQYATLEHLLLALTCDVDALAVMKACNVDLCRLKYQLACHVDNELKELVIDDGGGPRPSAAVQRVLQRAVVDVQRRANTITGAPLLVALFAERESTAVRLLGEQGMTRLDALNFIARGIVKAAEDDGPRTN